jgi:hypothetical protein
MKSDLIHSVFHSSSSVCLFYQFFIFSNKIVFICDGYFAIIKTNITNKGIRFMKTASKLPLELQALLIHRLSGSSKQNITGKLFNDNLGVYIERYIQK